MTRHTLTPAQIDLARGILEDWSTTFDPADDWEPLKGRLQNQQFIRLAWSGHRFHVVARRVLVQNGGKAGLVLVAEIHSEVERLRNVLNRLHSAGLPVED